MERIQKMLNKKFVDWYSDLYLLTHKIFRNEVTQIKGKEIDEWQERTDLFVREMAKIVDKLTR